MKLRFFMAFYLAKMVQFALRCLKRNATFLPGKIAIKVCPDFLKYIDKPKKIIAVTGTNGKTTVCNIINDVLEDNGYNVLNNRLGSNVNAGIASSLISGANFLNKTKKEIAVFEVDERSSILIYKFVKPDYLLCTNLFRDSIKRNANTDYILGIINEKLPKDTIIITNADDLIACSVGKENKKIYYGIDKLNTDVDETHNIIKDIKTCPKCDSKLKYNYARYHHIGNAYCPNCDFKSPTSDYSVTLINGKSNEIVIKEKKKSYRYSMLIDNIINVYNELSAITLLRTLGLSPQKINNSLKKTKVVATRFSKENVNGIEIITQLSKAQNPVAATRAFDYVSSLDGDKALILIIDDRDDAKTTSEHLTWLYDADFELLNKENIKKIIIGGVRCNDFYLRLLLAGVPEEKLVKSEDEYLLADYVEKDQIEKVIILHAIDKFDIATKLKNDIKKKFEN